MKLSTEKDGVPSFNQLQEIELVDSLIPQIAPLKDRTLPILDCQMINSRLKTRTATLMMELASLISALT